MLATQVETRSRLEHLKLNHDGYKRQLTVLDLSAERRERLEIEVRFLQEEIATLEKITQMGRVEPDRERVEAAVRERLEHLREQMASDPGLAAYSPEERDQSSGELKALLWALGEDMLTRSMRQIMKEGDHPDPAQTDRQVAAMLLSNLEQAPDAESRASAAYELGKLKIAQAIPALASALGDQPLVAEMALQALASFSDEQLSEAGLPVQVTDQIKAARTIE